MPVQKRPAPVAASRAVQRGPQAVHSNAQINGSGGGGFASLNPEDFTQGGLLDDIDVVFKQCRFVSWDYNGSIDTPVLALMVEFEYNDNGKQASSEQYYSAGDMSRFVPSEDGCRASAVAGAKSLNNNTNAAMLIKSVVEQGFPADRFGDGDISVMDGLHAHINRVPQPSRGGNISEKNNAGYDKTVAIVTKIHKMPWEQASGSKAQGKASPVATATRPNPTTAAMAPGRSAATKPPSDANPEPDDFTEEAAGIMIAVLDAKNGEVKKSQLAAAAFKPLSGNPNRSGILALITSDDWLAEQGENFGWAYENSTVTASA
jgi:hypothetical protein